MTASSRYLERGGAVVKNRRTATAIAPIAAIDHRVVVGLAWVRVAVVMALSF
jgi:hypothetical protein